VGVSYIFQALSELDSSLYSYFLKDGTVSEFGTHDELIARRGDYYEHVQLQGLSRN
jgi:ATP-binding cassette subfamily B (MDR/TAP) protein 1